MDTLIFIEKEDGKVGCIDEFLDLIFPEIAEESGFLVQAMGFIDDEPLKCVGGSFCECTRANEEIGNAGFL